METNVNQIDPVIPRQGEPLYETVSRAILQAIDQGIFLPARRMPTTKELSKQLSVSLVTTHRALQGLVAVGVLRRVRGMGTFVVESHKQIKARLTIGLISHAEASMGEYYHGRIIDGMRQAAKEHHVDIVLMDYEYAAQSDVAGYIMINPVPNEFDRVAELLDNKKPMMIIGTESHRDDVPSINSDNIRLAANAVEHLHMLGHKRIGYVGGGTQLGDSRDRRAGFIQACQALDIPPHNRPILDVPGYRLQTDENLKLNRMISESEITAVFAGGYYLALDVYHAASTMGLSIPDDITVVGVDDPPSAAKLLPPMTTFSQPLAHMGHAAIGSIRKLYDYQCETIRNETLQAELIIRQSSSTPKQ